MHGIVITLPIPSHGVWWRKLGFWQSWKKIRSIGGEITNDGDFQVFEGNRYSRKGFMNKQFVMNAILAESVKPTLA